MVSLFLTSLPVMANDVNYIYNSGKGKKKNSSHYSKEEYESEGSYSYRESNDGDFMDELIVRKSESVVIPGDEGTYFDVDNYISNMFL